MITVDGPDDVIVGDLVQFLVRGQARVGEVTKVGRTRLTIRFPDGSCITKAYTQTQRRDRYLPGPRTYQRPLFERLTAQDRWLRRRPSDVGKVVFNQGKAVTVVVEASVVGAQPSKAAQYIHEVAAWLNSKPSENAR
jgi:hypothetical protein